MSDSYSFLFCRHCGSRFIGRELSEHESQCSERESSEHKEPSVLCSEHKEPAVSSEHKEPVVSKRVLQDGKDGGPKETQVITKYPDDGTKKVVTQLTEKDDHGTKEIVTTETEDVDDEGVVQTTHKTLDSGRKDDKGQSQREKVVKKTVTTKDDGTQEVRKTTEYHEEAPGRVQRRVQNRVVQDSSNTKENEDALQQLRDMAPDSNMGQVSCLHCDQQVPREEYLQHAKDCRSQRKE